MFDIQGNKIILKTDELAIPPFKDYYNKAKDKVEDYNKALERTNKLLEL